MKKAIIICLLAIITLPLMSLNQMEYAKNQDVVVKIKTTSGNIEFALFPEKAPENVENIIKLVKNDFYNQTTFHRVIPGFVIQGGDPNSKDNDPSNDGYGGPGYYIKDEIDPELKHIPGTVALAKARPDQNGSQFYICLDTLQQLDGQYTIIGQVINGMETVEKIAQVETGERDRPIDDVVMTDVHMKEPEKKEPADTTKTDTTETEN